MIFLLNKERVFVDTMFEAQERLASWLGIPVKSVTVQIERSKTGAPVPVFRVDREHCKVGERVILDCIKEVYARCKEDMELRLKHLDTRVGDG